MSLDYVKLGALPKPNQVWDLDGDLCAITQVFTSHTDGAFCVTWTWVNDKGGAVYKHCTASSEKKCVKTMKLERFMKRAVRFCESRNTLGDV